MGDVFRFPGHFLKSPYVRGEEFCLRCYGYAKTGSLPSDCPGEPMHAMERAAVLNGHVDFKGGRWINVGGVGRIGD